jgi:hypothetical protein
MLNSMFGILAAAVWLLLSVITALGLALGQTGNVMVNVSMATIFVLVGGFLLWRTRSVAMLHGTHPADPIVKTFLRTQLVADLVMALLGLALASAAGFRILREGMPVFG